MWHSLRGGCVVASAPNVLPIFPEPDGNNSADAIADAIRKTKSGEGFTNGDLAFHLRCDASTVENAEAKRNLLKFDTVARLLRKYPKYCGAIRQLWEPAPAETPTPLERISLANQQIAAAMVEMEATTEQAKRYAKAMEEMRAAQ